MGHQELGNELRKNSRAIPHTQRGEMINTFNQSLLGAEGHSQNAPSLALMCVTTVDT
jgi:hypothetical protein